MPRSLCLLTLLLGAANVGADGPPDHAARDQIVVHAGCPASCGYAAEVEVSLGGVTRHGRMIVTGDGCVHLEHLDEQARRWAFGVIPQQSFPSKGWDDRPLRAGPVRCVWGRLGQNAVLAEIHAPDASLKMSRHELLSDR